MRASKLLKSRRRDEGMRDFDKLNLEFEPQAHFASGPQPNSTEYLQNQQYPAHAEQCRMRTGFIHKVVVLSEAGASDALRRRAQNRANKHDRLLQAGHHFISAVNGKAIAKSYYPCWSISRRRNSHINFNPVCF